jgi:hypothetical protein
MISVQERFTMQRITSVEKKSLNMSKRAHFPQTLTQQTDHSIAHDSVVGLNAVYCDSVCMLSYSSSLPTKLLDHKTQKNIV